MFLAKSHRPEVYRETVKQEHSGDINVRYVNNWRSGDTQATPDA
jgi:hypothetical protein